MHKVPQVEFMSLVEVQAAGALQDDFGIVDAGFQKRERGQSTHSNRTPKGSVHAF